MFGIKKLKTAVKLQAVVLIYTFASIFAKLASGEIFFSVILFVCRGGAYRIVFVCAGLAAGHEKDGTDGCLCQSGNVSFMVFTLGGGVFSRKDHGGEYDRLYSCDRGNGGDHGGRCG